MIRSPNFTNCNLHLKGIVIQRGK